MAEQTTPRSYQRLLSNGTWYDITDERMAGFLDEAVEFQNQLAEMRSKVAPTRDELVAQAETGEVRYGPDWYAKIRRKPAPRPRVTVEYTRCDCGHSVPFGQVMSASLGTSCHRCYDRMSGEE